MTMNPMKEGQRLVKKLEEMDKRLSKGEEVSKSEFDSLLAQLKNVSQIALTFGLQFPVFKSLGNMTHQRIEAVIKRARKDVEDPNLFIIEGGMIRRRES